MSDVKIPSAIPAWMPKDDERLAAARVSAFDGMYYITGLRAQIAVLEEMAKRFETRGCICGIQLEDEIECLRKELGE